MKRVREYELHLLNIYPGQKFKLIIKYVFIREKSSELSLKVLISQVLSVSVILHIHHNYLFIFFFFLLLYSHYMIFRIEV